MVTIFLFIAILALLVLVHEFGHFIIARLSGMRVDEFGIGFPPRLWGRRVGETLFSFNLIPAGGFVKIFGEEGADADDPRSFSTRPISRRAAVIMGGVLMNFLVAYMLFSLVHIIGAPTLISDDADIAHIRSLNVQIVEVVQDSPASRAGLQAGDKILTLQSLLSPNLDGMQQAELLRVNKVAPVQDFIMRHKGEAIIFTVKRGADAVQLNVDVRSEFPEGEGPTGIGLVRVGIVASPWYLAPVEGARTVVFSTVAVFGGLMHAVKSGISSGSLPADIAGPVGIAAMTGTVRDLGISYFIQFVALISLNLGIINIMPFPALDGGRLVFLAIEKIKGTPVNKKIEGLVHTGGFALLLLLIVAITWKDIGRLL